MSKKSEIEAKFKLDCDARGLAPVPEYKFHPDRRWRFDFAFPERMIAVECEGGVWSNGRHTRGSGFIADMEKYNAAAALGWFVFRFDASQVKSGNAINFMVSVLASREKSC